MGHVQFVNFVIYGIMFLDLQMAYKYIKRGK